MPSPRSADDNQGAKAASAVPDTIRDWYRGILPRYGGSPRRPIYRVDDVLSAKLAPSPTGPISAPTRKTPLDVRQSMRHDLSPHPCPKQTHIQA